jgi:hypothetical protein
MSKAWLDVSTDRAKNNDDRDNEVEKNSAVQVYTALGGFVNLQDYFSFPLGSI